MREDDGSVYSMPSQWTSLHVPDGFELASEGRAKFRPDDLLKLVELLSSIEEGRGDGKEADNV